MSSSHAERLVAELMARSTPSGHDRFEGLDQAGTAWAVVDAMGRCVDAGFDRQATDGLDEALENARMKASVAILVQLRGRRP